MSFFNSGYNEWKSRWENASKKSFDAHMKACALDDAGEGNTAKFDAWHNEAKSWDSVKDSLKESDPKFFVRYRDSGEANKNWKP